MLLVCISHFGWMYFGTAGDVASSNLAGLIALPASPTFIVLSGLALGLIHRREPARFAALSWKMFDRGLFLLIPAHLAIMAAHRYALPRVRFVFMTDAIGFCLLLGPWLTSRLSGRARLCLGLTLIVLTWCLALGWEPIGKRAIILQHILIGQEPLMDGWITFPLLPWFGVYMMATVLGECCADWAARGRGLAGPLTLLAAGAIGLGLCLFALGRGQPRVGLALLSALQKYPPGPAYLLIFGGVGLFMLAAIEWLHAHRVLRPVWAMFSTVGRSALIVFVAQYYIYVAGFSYLDLPISPYWPIYFMATLFVLFCTALCWQNRFGNDYLTVGLQVFQRKEGSRAGWRFPRQRRPA